MKTKKVVGDPRCALRRGSLASYSLPRIPLQELKKPTFLCIYGNAIKEGKFFADERCFGALGGASRRNAIAAMRVFIASDSLAWRMVTMPEWIRRRKAARFDATFADTIENRLLWHNELLKLNLCFIG